MACSLVLFRCTLRRVVPSLTRRVLPAVRNMLRPARKSLPVIRRLPTIIDRRPHPYSSSKTLLNREVLGYTVPIRSRKDETCLDLPVALIIVPVCLKTSRLS